MLFLLANMMPQEALIYPLYYVAKEVGLYNTQLVGDHHLHRHPERVRHLPARLGARHVPARAAGGGRAGRRRQVDDAVAGGLPRTCGRPSSVLLIFFFIWTWNEFLIPLVMLIDNATQTIPVALASLQGDRLMDAPTTNAGALISLVPAIIFFLIFQRTLTRGITAGAEK